MKNQTERFQQTMKCKRLKKLSSIWNSSLTVVGTLGILVLILSYFLTKNVEILMFGQILATVSFAVLFFFCYMLMLRGCGRNVMVLLIMLGSGGKVFGFISQIMTDQIIEKPPILNMAAVIISIGVITLLNKTYNGNNIGCEV